MTDGEMADKWVKEHCDDSLYSFRGQELKEAFLAGLNASRPQWHDLRKDPNDLPDNDRVVSDQEGTNVRYVKFRDKWFYLDRTAEANIIAWCDVPKYEEE